MKYGLIGEKLGHSFSKGIHSQIADYNYELKEIDKEELKEFLTTFDTKKYYKEQRKKMLNY